jgi:predicted phosphoribosyltransferase/pimeloyl-ACP methyl ester carboxylesterase
LGVPGLEEVAFGAIAEGGDAPVLDGVHDYIGLPRRVVAAVHSAERLELKRRIMRYRAGRSLPSLGRKTVIVVDDGLASGATLKSAALALRRHRPSRLIAAVPVASNDGMQETRLVFDEVVALATPLPFGTVSDWYHQYDAVDDAEVSALLGRSRVGNAHADIKGVAALAVEAVRSPVGTERELAIPTTEPCAAIALSADLGMPAGSRIPHGLVILAHGGGSSRASFRNRYLAARLRLAGWATLRVDLLTEAERTADSHGALRFDIEHITRRLLAATRWCIEKEVPGSKRIVLFGASTGAAAALGVASTLGAHIAAVVSRGGRVDLAGDHLARVCVPSLFIVGSDDVDTLRLNRESRARLGGPVTLRVIRGAGHTFDEVGALGAVGECVTSWLNWQHRVDGVRQWLRALPLWPANRNAGMLARESV